MAALGFCLLSLFLSLPLLTMSTGDSNNAVHSQVTKGNVLSFDHLTFYAGNAKQAAYYWCVKFGFLPSAYAGLETGRRHVASHVVTQGDITLVFQTVISPRSRKEPDDGLKDIAFVVDDVDAMFKKALAGGGSRPIRKPFTLSDPKDGEVRMAIVRIGDGYTHTFVDRSRYSGIFLPGYEKATLDDTLVSALPDVGLTKIDFVGVMAPTGSLKQVISSYEKALGFQTYMLMIDDPITTDNIQDVKTVYLSNSDQTVVMAFLNPFHIATNYTHLLDEVNAYKGGPGPIDTSFLTDDLVNTVKSMRQRGETFLDIDPAFYSTLKKRIAASSAKIAFDIDEFQNLDIVLDFSDDGKSYQLDAATALPQDTPTYFLLVKQRVGRMSYSLSNYNAIYSALESDQDERGNL